MAVSALGELTPCSSVAPTDKCPPVFPQPLPLYDPAPACLFFFLNFCWFLVPSFARLGQPCLSSSACLPGPGSSRTVHPGRVGVPGFFCHLLFQFLQSLKGWHSTAQARHLASSCLVTSFRVKVCTVLPEFLKQDFSMREIDKCVPATYLVFRDSCLSKPRHGIFKLLTA